MNARQKEEVFWSGPRPKSEDAVVLTVQRGKLTHAAWAECPFFVQTQANIDQLVRIQLQKCGFRRTAAALELYRQLLSYRNRKTGLCWMGQQRLAEESAVATRTVRARLQRLEAAGVVTAIHTRWKLGNFGTNHYVFHHPTDWDKVRATRPGQRRFFIRDEKGQFCSLAKRRGAALLGLDREGNLIVGETKRKLRYHGGFIAQADVEPELVAPDKPKRLLKKLAKILKGQDPVNTPVEAEPEPVGPVTYEGAARSAQPVATVPFAVPFMAKEAGVGLKDVIRGAVKKAEQSRERREEKREEMAAQKAQQAAERPSVSIIRLSSAIKPFGVLSFTYCPDPVPRFDVKMPVDIEEGSVCIGEYVEEDDLIDMEFSDPADRRAGRRFHYGQGHPALPLPEQVEAVFRHCQFEDRVPVLTGELTDLERRAAALWAFRLHSEHHDGYDLTAPERRFVRKHFFEVLNLPRPTLSSGDLIKYWGALIVEHYEDKLDYLPKLTLADKAMIKSMVQRFPPDLLIASIQYLFKNQKRLKYQGVPTPRLWSAMQSRLLPIGQEILSAIRGGKRVDFMAMVSGGVIPSGDSRETLVTSMDPLQQRFFLRGGVKLPLWLEVDTQSPTVDGERIGTAKMRWVDTEHGAKAITVYDED